MEASIRRCFRAAVFDMDGLLLDSERPIVDAWSQAADELDCSFEPELLIRVLGRPGKEGVALFRESLGVAFPYERVRERVQVLLAAQRERPYPVKAGAEQLLRRCRAAGVPCAVASSTRREALEARLSAAGLHGFFSAFAGGDEVLHGKPAPDIFELAAARLGHAPRECLVFEDSEHGAEGARGAGMGVVIVPDLREPSDHARGYCVAVLASLSAVEPHFADWFSTALR